MVMFDQEKARIRMEEFKGTSSQIIDKVREIIREGKARRIKVRKDDRTLMEIPLAVGAGGAAALVWLTPTLAALGALAALVTEDLSIIVEKDVEIEVDDM